MNPSLADQLAPYVVIAFFALFYFVIVVFLPWIARPRLGSCLFGSIDELISTLLLRLGPGRTFVVRGWSLDKVRFSTRLSDPSRQASLSFFNSIGPLGRTPHLRIELDLDSPVRLSLSKRGVTTLDQTLLAKALKHRPEVRALLDELPRNSGLDSLTIWGGKLTATVPLKKVEPEQYPELLAKLHRIAGAFERTPLHVRVLGGERGAFRGIAGSPRCALCHDSITGEEPDLVACERCHTVLHEACWGELGRCPVLGCDGTRPERGRELAPAPSR